MFMEFEGRKMCFSRNMMALVIALALPHICGCITSQHSNELLGKALVASRSSDSEIEAIIAFVRDMPPNHLVDVTLRNIGYAAPPLILDRSQTDGVLTCRAFECANAVITYSKTEYVVPLGKSPSFENLCAQFRVRCESAPSTLSHPVTRIVLLSGDKNSCVVDYSNAEMYINAIGVVNSLTSEETKNGFVGGPDLALSLLQSSSLVSQSSILISVLETFDILSKTAGGGPSGE